MQPQKSLPPGEGAAKRRMRADRRGVATLRPCDRVGENASPSLSDRPQNVRGEKVGGGVRRRGDRLCPEGCLSGGVSDFVRRGVRLSFWFPIQRVRAKNKVRRRRAFKV